MAKDWVRIDTIYKENNPKTKAEQQKASRKYKSLMAKTKTLPIIEIKKRSIELFNKNKAEEDNLLQAYEDKRLKSKKAIKQAIRIKKERAKRKNSAKQDTEKVSTNKETTDNPV